MQRSAIALLCLVSLLACKKDKDQATADSPAASERIAASDTSPLWAHAPKDAVFGVVVADGTLDTMFDIKDELQRIVSMVPKGRELVTEARKGFSSEAPFDVLDRSAYAKSGIDLSKGAAFFISPNEDLVAVFPVGDAAAFRKLTKATTETVDGREFDRLKHAYCLAKDQRYICAESVSLVDEAFAKRGGDLANKVNSLGDHLRGDIELVALLDKIPEAQSNLKDLEQVVTNVKTGVLSARLKSGRMTYAGWLEATPPADIRPELEAIPFSKDIQEAGAGAVAAYSVRIPMSKLTRTMPPAMPVGATDLRKVLVDQLTGEMSLFTTGSSEGLGFAVIGALGMKDTEELATALESLCPMASFLPGLTIEAKAGKCTGTIDASSFNQPELADLGKIPVTIETKSSAVILRAGGGQEGADLATGANGMISKYVLSKPHNFYMWGRWSDPFAIESGAFAKAIATVKKQTAGAELDIINMMRLMMGHLFESAMALKLDGKGAHLVGEFTTMAADEDAAYQAYSSMLGEALASGANYGEKLKALAAKYPDSLLARQDELTRSGAPSIAFGAGVAAAIAVPAFAKYKMKAEAAGLREAARATEAEIEALEAGNEALEESSEALEAERKALEEHKKALEAQKQALEAEKKALEAAQ